MSFESLTERIETRSAAINRSGPNAVQKTIRFLHRDYFRIRSPIARRLYEIARKHCGKQSSWRIDLELLQQKTGSLSTLKEFRRALAEIAKDPKTLLEYDFTVLCCSSRLGMI
jgi:plasmid replication initiation protein